MSNLLNVGQRITTPKGTAKIVEFLGAGAQGEVYRADIAGKSYALKWYFPQMGTASQRQILEALINIGSPNRSFLWPLSIVSSPSIKGFGYIMGLRPKSYYSIVDLMKRRAEPSFKVLIRAAILMVANFRLLHKKGLCYRDISFGNLFFDVRTGDVLICDNDNVTTEKSQLKSVLGTPRFMAPEIVRGDCYPNISSDLFSISVLLFYMFMVHHPLEGRLESKIKCFDLPAMTRLYGTHPVFIFDPLNRSNRPVDHLHANANAFWQVYPRFFKDAFVQSFTKGLNPSGRLDENDWLKVLIRLSHSIQTCDCGAENFYDDKVHRHTCWACEKQLPPTHKLHIDKRALILDKHCAYGDYQMQMHADVFSYTPVCKVVAHPTKAGVFGLKNTSSSPWQARTPKGEQRTIQPQKSITIQRGLTIDFGSIKGTVR